MVSYAISFNIHHPFSAFSCFAGNHSICNFVPECFMFTTQNAQNNLNDLKCLGANSCHAHVCLLNTWKQREAACIPFNHNQPLLNHVQSFLTFLGNHAISKALCCSIMPRRCCSSRPCKCCCSNCCVVRCCLGMASCFRGDAHKSHIIVKYRKQRRNGLSMKKNSETENTHD